LKQSRRVSSPRNDPADVELEAQRLRLELSERDDLLSIAAHELRNPLHALSLQLALVRTTAEAQGQQEIASRAAKALNTLARYIDRVTVMLELLRAPSAYPLNLQPVDLGALLQTLVDTMAHEALFHGVTVTLTAPEECHVVTDPIAIEQVVQNLLLNGFKHAGCTAMELTLTCDAAQVRIDVADNGRGIAPADQARIFGKFGVAEYSARGTGSGLGLWIVRKLLDALGGEIMLQSSLGKGCLFTIVFASTSVGECTR
jgi:two-component system OmpR family sensor kinase